jgi:hypothetical protein
MPPIMHRIRINIRIRCIIIIALNYKTIQRIICNFLLINYLRTAADGRCKVFSCIGLPSRNVGIENNCVEFANFWQIPVFCIRATNKIKKLILLLLLLKLNYWMTICISYYNRFKCYNILVDRTIYFGPILTQLLHANHFSRRTLLNLTFRSFFIFKFFLMSRRCRRRRVHRYFVWNVRNGEPEENVCIEKNKKHRLCLRTGGVGRVIYHIIHVSCGNNAGVMVVRADNVRTYNMFTLFFFFVKQNDDTNSF